MINIDKEKMNESINEAYNNQTEKVKELLESAKKNLADQKQCSYDYSTNKEKANKFHTVSRVVTKKKEKEERLENNINDRFEEMNEKLEINSKNLDFIFQNVAENNKNEVTLLEDISRKQKESANQVIESIEKIGQENFENKQHMEDLADKVQKYILDTQTEILKQVSEKQISLEENLTNGQVQAEKKIIKSQIKAQNKVLNSQTKAIEKILEAKQEKEEKIIEEQRLVKKEVIEGQSKLEGILLDANSSIEHNILAGQKQVEQKIVIVEAKLEERLQEMQMQNEEVLKQIKQEIMQSYQKENKHAINTLLEERNSYLKELQEKDREIRQLNYKIYEYEEKLEKEIAKRERFSIFASFFKKQEVQEEETTYTSQILNYVYEQ